MSTEQTITTPAGKAEEKEEEASGRRRERGRRDVEALVGETLSERYLIEGCLGSGGMGAVYQAEHTLMKKKVAVKVLHGDITGHGEAVERFRREAQAAAHIDHPNVCVATDFGEMPDGRFFLVMEYLEGNTLDERLVCVERFEPKRALHIARQICDALIQAHRRGIVHRDLKPENVMLVHRGGDTDFVKIMDFGVARVRIGDGEAAGAKITQAGRVYGTPHYMAPEQAAGSESVDHRADLYSLGVLLFEMLTGTLPFADESATRVMAMHMTREPPSIEERAPDVDFPRGLADLVDRLMAKEPDDRPESAEEVREALDEVIARADAEPTGLTAHTRELAARSTGALKRVGRRLAPHLKGMTKGIRRLYDRYVSGPTKKLLGIGALVVATFVVGSFVTAALVGPSGPAVDEEDRRAQAEALADERAESGLDEAAEALEDGETSAAIEHLEEAAEKEGDDPHLAYLSGRAHLEDGEVGEALDAYAEALEGEPRYASEDRLVEDLVAIIVDGNEEASADAVEVLLEGLPEEVANARLSEIAQLGEGKARDRAVDALEGSGRIEALEPYERASIELRAASGCEEHRERIEELVEMQDPRALEVLRFYDEQPESGCGSMGREDCYGCIRGDLGDAIEELEALE
ncbi:MAG: serine/threonine protein kinase [Persicimonas sp.]